MSLIATRLDFWYGTVTALNVTAGNHHVHQIRLLSAHLRSEDAGREKRNVILGATGTGCNRSETSARTQSGDPINRNVLTFAVQGCMLTGSNQAITTVVPCYHRLDSGCVVVSKVSGTLYHRTSCTSYP
jgi:hypothetical protein